MLKISKYYGRHHDLVNRYGFFCVTDDYTCSHCHSHNQVIFVFMTYHRIIHKINTMCAATEAGAAYHFEEPNFTAGD